MRARPGKALVLLVLQDDGESSGAWFDSTPLLFYILAFVAKADTRSS